MKFNLTKSYRMIFFVTHKEYAEFVTRLYIEIKLNQETSLYNLIIPAWKMWYREWEFRKCEIILENLEHKESQKFQMLAALNGETTGDTVLTHFWNSQAHRKIYPTSESDFEISSNTKTLNHKEAMELQDLLLVSLKNIFLIHSEQKFRDALEVLRDRLEPRDFKRIENLARTRIESYNKEKEGSKP